MIWFLALGPDDAKQDLVMHDTTVFGVVFLVKGPRTTCIQ